MTKLKLLKDKFVDEATTAANRNAPAEDENHVKMLLK